MKWSGDIISLQTTVVKRGQMSEVRCDVYNTAQDAQVSKSSETNCLCSSLGRLCSFPCWPGQWIRSGTHWELHQVWELVSSDTRRVAKGKSKGRGETAGRVRYVLWVVPSYLQGRILGWCSSESSWQRNWGKKGPGHRYLVLKGVCGPRG